MKNISQITTIMARMSELLRAGDEAEWAERFDHYRLSLPGDTTYVLAKIVGLYGGMGSLTDIVLYRNGQPLINENDELADLRTKLYELCVGA
jgi:hypothetical protein